MLCIQGSNDCISVVVKKIQELIAALRLVHCAVVLSVKHPHPLQLHVRETY